VEGSKGVKAERRKGRRAESIQPQKGHAFRREGAASEWEQGSKGGKAEKRKGRKQTSSEGALL